MKKRAKRYFLLGDQYFETAKLLLETLINNGNSNAGIGKTEEEAYKQMVENVSKSDLYLFVPAIFNCLQSTELFIKGLLLLNNIEINDTHDVQKLLEKIKNSYTENSAVFKEFKRMYYSQENILKEFKKDNNITNSRDLYMSLRYPEKNDKKHTEYLFNSLMYNGEEGIKLFSSILENLEEIKNVVLIEYNRLYDETRAE